MLREEIKEAFKHLMIEKAPGSSEAYVKMNLASGDVGNIVLIELCGIY